MIWQKLCSAISSEREVYLKLNSRIGSEIYVEQFCDFYRFNVLLKLFKLAIMQIFAANITPTTIRDIYYKDVEIYRRNQDACNKSLILIFERSLNVSLEKDLQIYPLQKGLVFGNIDLEIVTRSLRTTLTLDYSQEAILIPIFESVSCNARVDVIVLEKDAVFKSLCTLLQKENPNNHIVVITGKGFPDRLTRRFLRCLTENNDSTFTGYFDSDVYGIGIYRLYREFCPKLAFGGIKLICTADCLNISYRDYRLMVSTISKLKQSSSNDDIALRELQRGLFLHKKAEMNSLTDLNKFILAHFREKQV